jgi:rhodanese-related sulfurtransferase
VLYGDSSNWFAAYAFWLLKYHGHKDVRLLNGGRQKWLAEGRPSSTERPTYPRAAYNLDGPDPSIRALRDFILPRVAQPGVALVDVRSPKEYKGELVAPEHLPQEGAQRAGHIPGAKNIVWSEAVREDGTFKSADELREIYGSQDVTGDKEVFTVVSASVPHTWFVLSICLAALTQLRWLLDMGSWSTRRSIGTGADGGHLGATPERETQEAPRHVGRLHVSKDWLILFATGSLPRFWQPQRSGVVTPVAGVLASRANSSYWDLIVSSSWPNSS